MTEEIPLKPARGGLALPIDWEALKQAAIAGVDFRVLAIQFKLFDKHGKPNTNAIRQRAYRESWPIAARIVRVARKNLKEAMQAAHKQGQEHHAHHEPPSYNTNTERDNTRGETNELEMEPGLCDHGIGEGSKDLLSIGKVGNQDTGGKRETSIVYRDGRELGKDASQSLQSSESTAATLIQSHMAQLAQESIIQALTRAHASIHAAPAQLPIATLQDLRTALSITMQASGMDKAQNNTQLNILVSPTPKSGAWNFHDSPESLTIDT